MVERVDATDPRGASTLYVRGGISGSLHYTIPASAVSAVSVEDRARIRTEVAVEFFRTEHGRDPADAREIGLHATAKTRPTPRIARRREWQ